MLRTSGGSSNTFCCNNSSNSSGASANSKIDFDIWKTRNSKVECCDINNEILLTPDDNILLKSLKSSVPQTNSAPALPGSNISHHHHHQHNNNHNHLNHSNSSSSGQINVQNKVDNDFSTNNSIPMEFIQVLIHQHAKTLVALQDLQEEVLNLKSSSSSNNKVKHHHHTSSSTVSTLPLSQSTTLGASSSSAILPGCAVHQSDCSCCCWQNHLPPNLKPSDSGFTETKSNNQKSGSEDESDELYSLLSLIQYKVQSLSYRKENSNPNAVSKPELGVLDKCLGNSEFDFKKFKLIDKKIISSILNCNDKVELRRQLLFTVARLNTVNADRSPQEPQGVIDASSTSSSSSNGTNATRSLLRALEALKSENEHLRIKLQQMEIEVEGTNAKLRILSKKQHFISSSTSTNHDNDRHHNNLDKVVSENSSNFSQIPSLVKTQRQQQQHDVNNKSSDINKKDLKDNNNLVVNKSLSSIGSNNNRSLIPVPVTRLKKKNSIKKALSNSSGGGPNNTTTQNNNFWNQWFG